MPLILAVKTPISSVLTPVFGILKTKSCNMKLEIENTDIWHLNASIWAFKRRHLVLLKSTPDIEWLLYVSLAASRYFMFLSKKTDSKKLFNQLLFLDNHHHSEQVIKKLALQELQLKQESVFAAIWKRYRQQERYTTMFIQSHLAEWHSSFEKKKKKEFS